MGEADFLIRDQDEIQAAHFRHSQATIFTACAWTNVSVIEFLIRQTSSINK